MDAAVAAARRASVAVVFTGELQREGADRSLALPGDADQLIAAVAAVNPHTVVVINSGGAVYMPWLSKVAGVLEAWYPGEADGTAVAAVLTGRVDPSGRLPITFPATPNAQPASAVAEFPGIDAEVSFGAGSRHRVPVVSGKRRHPAVPVRLWARLHHRSTSRTRQIAPSPAGGYTVEVDVNNIGSRSGADVVQVYVAYPSGLGEPPEQLRAFKKVVVAPGATTRVTLVLPASDFASDAAGTPAVVAGNYVIGVGESSADLPIQLPVEVPAQAA